MQTTIQYDDIPDDETFENCNKKVKSSMKFYFAKVIVY